MKLEEWIEIKKKYHPVSGLEYDDVEKCLNIIEHLMKAVNIIVCEVELNTSQQRELAYKESVELANKAIEACEKEIG